MIAALRGGSGWAGGPAGTPRVVASPALGALGVSRGSSVGVAAGGLMGASGSGSRFALPAVGALLKASLLTASLPAASLPVSLAGAASGSGVGASTRVRMSGGAASPRWVSAGDGAGGRTSTIRGSGPSRPTSSASKRASMPSGSGTLPVGWVAATIARLVGAGAGLSRSAKNVSTSPPWATPMEPRMSVAVKAAREKRARMYSWHRNASPVVAGSRPDIRLKSHLSAGSRESNRAARPLEDTSWFAMPRAPTATRRQSRCRDQAASSSDSGASVPKKPYSFILR